MIRCNLTAKAKRGILAALAHHASNIRPVALELFSGFYLSDLDGVHDAPRNNGRQNTYVALSDGRSFFFHWDYGNEVHVRTRCLGPTKWVLKTRADAHKWLREVGIA